MSTTPIGDYALLSDRHSAALVSRDGSIDWLCFPRFDSPSIFGRLLGDEAGHWSIRTTSATQVTRRYLDRTMVLETTFRTPAGTVAITDALIGLVNAAWAISEIELRQTPPVESASGTSAPSDQTPARTNARSRPPPERPH